MAFMLEAFGKILVLLLRLILLAALFLICRVVAPRLGWPDWTALFLCAGTTVAWIGLRWTLGCIRDILEERRVAGAPGALFDARAEKADPAVAARMRLSWKSGRSLLRRFRHARALPWFLSLGGDGEDRRRLAGLVDLRGEEADHRPGCSEFTWHLSKKSVWLDLDFGLREDDGGRWRLFLSRLAANPDRPPVRGVAVMLDAKRLLTATDTELKREAALLRIRLDQLIRTCGTEIRAYLLINGIDALYGMPSLAAALPPAVLDEPLGIFRRDEAEPHGAFAARVVGTLAEALVANVTNSRNPCAAALQAPDEFARLSAPLARFCTEAFSPNPYQFTAGLRGIFFGAAETKDRSIPPLLSGLPSFRPLRESAVPGNSWFFASLLKNWIPDDPIPEKAIRGRTFSRAASAHAALAALLVGTLLLCWLTTLSFLEERQTLLSIAGVAAEPEPVRDLQAYLDRVIWLENRNRGRWLPHFGMNDTEYAEAELKRRYCESYRESRLIPRVRELREMAHAAVGGGNPRDLGDTLLRIAELRKDDGNESQASDGDTHLATEVEGAQLAMYRLWSRDHSGANEIQRICADLERTLIDNGGNGDCLQWLPAWVDGLADARAISLAEVWLPVRMPGREVEFRRIRAAWTHDGYARVREMLDGVVYNEHDGETWTIKRNAILSAYRREALAAWKAEAEKIWEGYQESLDDSLLHTVIRRAGDADNPAFRMAAILREHLLPIFAGEDGDPDILCLRRYAGPPTASPTDSSQWLALAKAFKDAATLSETADAGLAGMRARFGGEQTPDNSDDPFVLAKNTARALTGSAAWSTISPLAAYQHLRFVAVRAAAVHLETLWREKNAANASAIRPSDTGGDFDTFLAMTKGLWRMEADRPVNAEWEKLRFMLSGEFLDFCARMVASSRVQRPDRIVLPFRVEAVSVDSGARERPESVDILWGEGETEQKLIYRNYAVATAFEWKPDRKARLRIRIAFPTLTITKEFSGETQLADFLQRLVTGKYVLGSQDFPKDGPALRRLGITGIVLRASIGNVQELLHSLESTSPALPATVITRGGGAAAVRETVLRSESAVPPAAPQTDNASDVPSMAKAIPGNAPGRS